MAEEFRAHDYVGLSYAEARVLAAGRGWEPRRLSRDDVITAEFNPDRINLLVNENDAVVYASVGCRPATIRESVSPTPRSPWSATHSIQSRETF